MTEKDEDEKQDEMKCDEKFDHVWNYFYEAGFLADNPSLLKLIQNNILIYH